MIPTTPASSGLTGGLSRLRDQGRSLLSGFTTGQKAMTAIAVLTVIIGGYAFVSWAGKATYAPLFSNLSATDAAAITGKLTSAKVPYQLADGGTTIMVPQNDVYQERLNLSSAGLPGDTNSGYALLNKAGITTSQFQQQVDYQQAVQSELDKTIQAIQGVTAAVVHVVIPTDTLFAGPTNQPTASVLVQLAPGASLTATQVQAIVHLVASSIENLDPNNVTVVDDKGDVLSAPGTNSAAVAAGDAQNQQTQQFDSTLGTTLTNMLIPVLGPNNALVHVSADLNYDQTQTTSKLYDPNKTGPISVSSANSNETYTGAAATAAAGTLGTTTTPTTTGTGGGGTYSKVGSSTNAVVSEVDKTIQGAPGTINRLSVAVEINKSVKGVTAAQIQGIVAAAAGLVPSRGDTIQVTMLPFDTSATKTASAELKAAAAAKSSAQMMSMIRTALILLVVAGLLFYALRRITKTTRTELELGGDWDPMELDAASRPLEGYGTSTRVLEPAGASAVGRNPAVAELANQDPAQIANLLRSWLAEEDR